MASDVLVSFAALMTRVAHTRSRDCTLKTWAISQLEALGYPVWHPATPHQHRITTRTATPDPLPTGGSPPPVLTQAVVTSFS